MDDGLGLGAEHCCKVLATVQWQQSRGEAVRAVERMLVGHRRQREVLLDDGGHIGAPLDGRAHHPTGRDVPSHDRAIVRATRYPPQGARSFGPLRAAKYSFDKVRVSW